MTADFMEKNPTLRIVTAAALHSDAGDILVQQCPVGHAHAGSWEFPGGKVEAGETAEGALVRELREELSIEVDPGDCHAFAFSSDPNQRIEARSPYLILLYTCRKWRGSIVPREGQAVRWAAPDALLSLPMPPLDITLARKLQKSG